MMEREESERRARGEGRGSVQHRGLARGPMSMRVATRARGDREVDVRRGGLQNQGRETAERREHGN